MNKPASADLIRVLCNMSDADLKKAEDFHQYHLDQIRIQKKVRRAERED